MTTLNPTTSARQQLGDIPRQLTALEKMTTAELAERYLEVFGVPTRTRNKPYLKKRDCPTRPAGEGMLKWQVAESDL